MADIAFMALGDELMESCACTDSAHGRDQLIDWDKEPCESIIGATESLRVTLGDTESL